MKLSDLKPGQEAIISEFDSNELLLKLMEMGCVPGERVYLEQVAPAWRPYMCKGIRLLIEPAIKRSGTHKRHCN